MKFTNEFTVPSDVDTTFAALTDLERVAPCLPGASLTDVDGDDYHGEVKVKVGPMQLTYKGTARLVEADATAKRGRIEATGRETRGSGTAKAEIVADLTEVADGTRVTVETDLNITGKPAQFGRGILEQVGSKIIDQFAQRLSTMLSDEDGPAASEDAQSASSDDAPTRQPAADDDNALNFMDVAGGAIGRKLIPVGIGVVVIAALIWWAVSR